MDDILAALGKVDLLAGLKKRHLELIARVTERVDLDTGFSLIEQGQEMTHMSIIISGAASVEVDGHHVAVLGPGEVLGELSMIDPAPASATVTMTEPTSVWHVARVGFIPVWEKNKADMAPAMLTAVIRRLRETNKLLSS